MTKLGWTTVALIGLLLAGGITLIAAGHPDEGRVFTGIVAVGALALLGIKYRGAGK